MKLFAFLILTFSLAACGSGGVGGNGTAAAPVKAVAAPAGQDWTQTVSQTAEGYVIGNPAAPIKLAEYGSRLCPTCGAFAREGYEPLINTYVKSGKVSFEFRDFLVHGPADMAPSLLGNCVPAETFFPLLEQMFVGQDAFNAAWQKMTPAVQQQLQSTKPEQAFVLWGEKLGVIDFVKQRGLPEPKARGCLADAKMIDKLAKQTQDAGPGGSGTVTGTPTFLINGKVAEGVITWPAMVTALKSAGA